LKNDHFEAFTGQARVLQDARQELRPMSPRYSRKSFPVMLGALALILSAPIFAQYEGWTIPGNAKTEKSPYASSAADAAKKGKAVFQSKCLRCHGSEGKGNGPEADKDHKPADLTQIKTAENPDGVLFYKVWNGHAPKPGSKGEMPAFKVQLPKEDIWRAVEYVKTLHAQ
jgi:mono/diheme cytochrome c family protein